MGKAYEVLNTLHAIRQQFSRVADISDTDWQSALDDAANERCRIWTIHAPPADWDQVPSGVWLSYHNGAVGIINPVKIVPIPDTDLWIVINLYNAASIYTKAGVYRGPLPYGKYSSSVSTPDGYGRGFGGCMSPDGVKLVIPSYYDHYVRCFEHATGNVLWTFGDGVAGNPEDGHLYSPADTAFLPNGNVLVSCANGVGDPSVSGSRGYGYLVELDGVDGHLIAIRAQMTNANLGYGSRGGCYTPKGMAIDYTINRLFISNIGTDCVEEYDVELGFEHVNSYFKPNMLDAGAVDPVCCCYVSDDDAIAVYSDGMRAIGTLKRGTGDFLWSTGMPGWDNKDHSDNKPHELDSVFGLHYDADKKLLFACDQSNRRIMSLAKSNYHTIQYQITPPSAEYKLTMYPRGYDPNTGVLTIPVNEIDKVSYTCDPQLRGYLVLGWERKCV